MHLTIQKYIRRLFIIGVSLVGFVLFVIVLKIFHPFLIRECLSLGHSRLGTVNCGRVLPGGDPSKTDSCVIASFKSGKLFRAWYDSHGFDSVISQGFIRTSTDEIEIFNLDDYGIVMQVFPKITCGSPSMDVVSGRPHFYCKRRYECPAEGFNLMDIIKAFQVRAPTVEEPAVGSIPEIFRVADGGGCDDNYHPLPSIDGFAGSLGKMCAKAVPLLIRETGDKKPCHRLIAATALKNIQTKEAVDVAFQVSLSLLTDKNAAVRQKAVQNISEMIYMVDDASGIVPALSELLINGYTTNLGRDARLALEKIGTPEANQALLDDDIRVLPGIFQALNTLSTRWTLASRVLASATLLHMHPLNETAIPLVLSLLYFEKNKQVREMATRTLIEAISETRLERDYFTPEGEETFGGENKEREISSIVEKIKANDLKVRNKAIQDLLTKCPKHMRSGLKDFFDNRAKEMEQ